MERHDGMRSNRSAGWRQLLATVLLVMGGGVWADVNTCPDAELAAVLASAHRSSDAMARDSHRHPCETLMFFGVRSNMTVVEIWPGAGWYADILAPLLGPKGIYYAAHFNPASPSDFYRDTRHTFEAHLTDTPNLMGRTRLTTFDPAGDEAIAPPASADIVLTFRNIHNWYMRGGGDHRVQAAFKKMYVVLKPGGVLGVVEHRLPASRPLTEQEGSGYMRQDYVVQMAEAAGFRLVASSEINANPVDTADHPNGVWSLPPTLRGGVPDRERYIATGESDRMTLRFVKPHAQQLKPCPSRDNCVSSQERGSRYEIQPLRFKGSPREARDHLLRIITSRPGARIVAADAEHIKVEFRTRWLRFVDDADFLIGNGVVEVRSASRLGYSDFGVNRKRIEEIRQAFSGN